jgi:large subunit ribosomal protein L23
MRLFDIVKNPVVTEKSSREELKNWTYVIEVSDTATKIDIKKAILEIYWSEVSSVRVLNTREKFKQGKKGMVIRKRTSRKAYVTLKDANAKLDFSVIKF